MIKINKTRELDPTMCNLSIAIEHMMTPINIVE